MEIILQASLTSPLNAAEKKQKKGKAKPKTPGAGEEQEEPKEEIHASLTVHIRLLERAVCKVDEKTLATSLQTRQRAGLAAPYSVSRVRISQLVHAMEADPLWNH